MNNKTAVTSAIAAITLTLSTACVTSENVLAGEVYADFPVTLKGYSGSKTTSVAYTGQIARHLLHESLKKLAGKGNGSPNPDLETLMLAYFHGSEGLGILAPSSNGAFAFSASSVDDISKGKNLSGKTYKGAVSSWPGNLTGREVIEFWIKKAAGSDGGYDAANGMNYPQLISKFIMGAVFYNQIADNYLDEKLDADTKPNDQPYKDGAAYTGKEHSWDEGYGYFGSAAHTASLSAKQSYELAKRGSKSDSPEAALKLADYNGDGSIDYVSEMTYALAYYASSYDKGGKTNYLSDIHSAFLDGRKLITSADGEKLTDAQRQQLMAHAAVVKDGLEMVLAESVFKYAGSTFKDIQILKTVLESGGNPDEVNANYAKHWGELKGFSMALQTGGKDLGETAVRLNRMIGYSPVLANNSQVVDVDSTGNYVKDQGSGLDEYALHMLKIQKLMVDEFGVTARNKDQLGQIGDLMEQLGGSNSAEND